MHFGKFAAACGVACFILSPVTWGAVVSFDRPAMDVWMYDNGFNLGYRENAPTFGGPVGIENGSDDRLGQFLMGWNTEAAGISAGLAASQYAVSRVTLRVTQINESAFRYDPTHDAYRTYLPATDAEFQADADAGRPMELFGVGLRNGFTSLGVSGSLSGTPFGEATPTMSAAAGEHQRHAFAWSPHTPRPDGDVSENVSERFEAAPMAIGFTNDVAAGGWVPADTEFTFTLNLADPAILAYVQTALSEGQLGFMLSSLHAASFDGQPGEQSYPRFYTRDYYDFVDFVVPRLEIEYSVVPEPSGTLSLLLGLACLTALRALRRRDYYS